MTKTLVDEEGKRLYPIKESASRKGDIAEHYAIIWLWEEGYEVFINAGCTGAVDLIAKKDGILTQIDVKTRQLRKNRGTYSDTSGIRSKEQKDDGVHFLAFHPITKKCQFVDHKD